MPTRSLYGQTYDEIAVVAATPLPVDIGGSAITFTGNITLGSVTVTNTSASPVPVSDAGGSLTVDDGNGSITVDDGNGSITIDTALGAIAVSGPLTNSELRASAVPVSGPLTDTQLRASAVPVSGPLTDTQLRAAAVPVSGPLTDVQLRATAVPVSGPLTDAQLRASTVPVSGPLTDAQLRATALPVESRTLARTPTTTSVGGTATSTLVLAANASRKGLSVSNVSTSKLYLSFSSPATVANSFIEVQPSAFLLFDQQLIVANAIYGIWTNANGTAQVTEYV